MSDTTAITQRLLADEPAFAWSGEFGSHKAQGRGTGPQVLIGDLSQIGLLQGRGDPPLDHRLAHLASAGDFLLVHATDPAFQAYLQEYRGINGLTVLAADPADERAVATQAMTIPYLREPLVEAARAHAGLTLTSYLTTGTIWHLAQVIGAAAGCLVHVNGPAPQISERANDKLWFARIARDVIDDKAIPPTMSAYGPKAAAALALHLGRTGAQVIVKVPDSAGSTGNIRLDATLLAHQTVQSLEGLLLGRLHARGWNDRYPILVGVWDRDVISSPSVQLWIPQTKSGPPVAQGVFEQTVLGTEAAFVGAVRCGLPQSLQVRLIDQAIRIGGVLQALGYYGKCSLDAVICARGTIHWIECNARWGGVSLPLQILHDIAPDHTFDGVVVIQQMINSHRISTAKAIAALDPLLYRYHCNEVPLQGAVMLSPPASKEGIAANLLVFAPSQCAARQIGQEALERLIRAADLTV
ncbi:hypothetical protein C7964_104149 [Loktanella sp. PT4BL]|jgi:hypothetical protein|uniref:preATP grasp domain-containing protein n=1 Tax=Loktanella sp. PT4BL TaxID=2135611 RepID=UPI000D771F1E|nr:hypothetical protein [Loktanella sp. PT4BL]PXW68059.1 hypothetical protein C7964_104149 [Loktanella sp. PT4BL]